MPKIKELIKCKHPNSRKTNALIKKIKKTTTKEKNKLATSIKQNLVGEKLIWFKDNLESGSTNCTPKRLLEIIEKYLRRFDEELEQIRIKYSIGHRKNHRQHASREDAIKMTSERENREFESCGLEVPDLLDAQQSKLLQNWGGELRFLSNFKLKRYSRKRLLAEIHASENKMDAQ